MLFLLLLLKFWSELFEARLTLNQSVHLVTLTAEGVWLGILILRFPCFLILISEKRMDETGLFHTELHFGHDQQIFDVSALAD